VIVALVFAYMATSYVPGRDDSRHTQLLLLSAPAPEQVEANHRADSPLLATRGDPPSLINPPKGCRFHPRCPYAMPVCREQAPPRTDLGAGHWTHCFLYGETTKPGDLKPSQPTRVSPEE